MTKIYSNADIARTLEKEALNYPEDAPMHATKACFSFGSMRLRMRPTRQAILDVAGKYKKGRVVGPGLKPYSEKRAYAQLGRIGPFDWTKTPKQNSKALEEL